MSDQMESTGKTVDEAIREALLRMGLRREEVDVTVIQEARSGILGVGRRQAVVKVTKKSRGRSDRTDRTDRGDRNERGDRGRRDDRGGRRSGERLDDGRTGRGDRGRGEQRRRDEGKPAAARSEGRGEGRLEGRVEGRAEGRSGGRSTNRSTTRGAGRGEGRGASGGRPAAAAAADVPREADEAAVVMRAAGPAAEVRPEIDEEGRGGRRRRPRRRRKKFDGDESMQPLTGGELAATSDEAPDVAENDEVLETTPPAAVDRPVAAPASTEVAIEPEAEMAADQPAPPAMPATPKAPRRQAGAIVADVSAMARVQPFTAAEVAALPDFLQRVATDLMVKSGFACRVQVQEGEYQLVKLVVDDRSAGVLIGRYGNTVDAVEQLVEKIASRTVGERVRMNLDINNYRVRREDQLVQRARNAAAEARNTGEPVALEPAGGRERRVVHLYIQETEDLTTYTENGPDGKYVVVCHPDQVPAEYRDRADGAEEGTAPSIEVAAVIDVGMSADERSPDRTAAD